MRLNIYMAKNFNDRFPGQKVYDARYVTKKWVPLFANPSGNEMWCLLLEKAMAKFVGTYARIAGGHEPFALIAFTGYSQVRWVGASTYGWGIFGDLFLG